MSKHVSGREDRAAEGLPEGRIEAKKIKASSQASRPSLTRTVGAHAKNVVAVVRCLYHLRSRIGSYRIA